MNMLSIVTGVLAGFFYGRNSLLRYQTVAQEALVTTPRLIPTLMSYSGLLMSAGLLLYLQLIDPLTTGIFFLMSFWAAILWGVSGREN